MSKVMDFHKEGYNCAESIVKTANLEMGLNIPVEVASPFGAGMSSGNTCGAIIGALMVIGAVKGRKDSKEHNESRQYAREFMTKTGEKYASFECRTLKKNGISCDEIIQNSYDLMKEIVAK